MKDDVQSIEDTYDDYMKNVFDKRQLGIKGNRKFNVWSVWCKDECIL